MNEALKTIALEMPRFLLNLVKLLINPAGFIEQLDFNPENKLTNLTKALTFTVIAYVLAETLSFLKLSEHLPANINMSMYYSAKLTIAIMTFVGLLIALYFSTRLFGSKATADDLLIIHSYYYGTFLIINLVFSSMLEGLLESNERLFGQSTMGLPSNEFLWLAPEALCLLVWGLFAWQAYRNKGALSIPKSTGALLLSIVLAVIVFLMSTLMSSAFLPAIKL